MTPDLFGIAGTAAAGFTGAGVFYALLKLCEKLFGRWWDSRDKDRDRYDRSIERHEASSREDLWLINKTWGERVRELETRIESLYRESVEQLKEQGRLRELIAAQAVQIGNLQDDVTRLNQELSAARQEADDYKAAKHRKDNELTARILQDEKKQRITERLGTLADNGDTGGKR